MRSLESPPVEVAIDSPERQDSVPSSSSNNGSGLHSGLGEAKHLMERLNTAQVKVKRLQRLEAALVDFFMEVMDRTGSNGGSNTSPRSLEAESTFARGKRKEQFLKKAEGDPISLLNGLRTHLRLKFAEQEAQEAAAERQALADSLNNQQNEQNTRDKFLQLELACKQLEDQQKCLMRQLNQGEVNQTRTRVQHQMLLEKLNAQIQEERSQEIAAQQLITKQRQEIAALTEARDALIKAAQSQKSLDGARAPGSTARGSPDANSSSTTSAVAGFGTSPTHTNGDFFGTPAENQTLRRALRKYEIQMAQTEATNEERKREVQRLQQQLTGLRQSTQLQMYSRLEKESRHVRELADDLKSRLAESEADLLRTKGTLKERENQAQKMKDEYARLFTAVQKQKQPAHYSGSKMTRSSSSMHLSQLNHSQQLPPRMPGGGLTEILSQLNENAGSTGATNGEHPYVVEYYRSEAARVERECEALKLQIRRMMASEQLHKQKTRVLRAERQNLVRERDQLRADLDRAKKHSTLQSVAMNRQQAHASVEPRKVGFSSAAQDVKHLQKRNAFLEERFRKALQSNSAFATIGAVARLRNSVSVPAELDGFEQRAIPEQEGESAGSDVDCHDARSARHNSAIFTKTRPASALATPSKNNEGSFRSLDAATLQSLQQVKRATRQSLLNRRAFRLTDNMNGGFDGLEGPKHERVSKALEQVNGFRYRYHPAPQDGKKMLRFDSDADDDLSDDEEDSDGGAGNKVQRRRSSTAKSKHTNDVVNALGLTLDDHIENLLCKTRTLAMLKIANNTAGTIPSDSEDDSDEADDVVSEELSIGSVGAPKHGTSSSKLSSLGSSSSMGGQQSSLLGTAAVRLARTLSAFLCLPRAISYGDLEAITEKLLESANDQFNDDEYADLIDCHVDSARDDDSHTEADNEEPIWKRRNSRPIRPLNLSEDRTDLELHQRQIFVEANRFGGVSSQNLFLASSKHLLSKDDPKGSMYFGVSPSGRLLGSSMNGSSMSLSFGKQGSGSTVTSSDDTAEDAIGPIDEEEYVKWRTQVKDDYLAWLNAKLEAKKRRKSRMKKEDANKKPRWLLLYEASKNPTEKYRPDGKQ
ncbi:hypothetical protein PRIC2_002436 [Phytophthora ramorum]